MSNNKCLHPEIARTSFGKNYCVSCGQNVEVEEIKKNKVSKPKYANARFYYCIGCEKPKPHYPITARNCFGCSACGKQFYPKAETIFKKSSTPMEKWEIAIDMCKENKWLQATDIQKAVKVTYKTAWRMKRLILNDLYPGFTGLTQGQHEPQPFRGNQYVKLNKDAE
jgi:hypothetical protein